MQVHHKQNARMFLLYDAIELSAEDKQVNKRVEKISAAFNRLHTMLQQTAILHKNGLKTKNVCTLYIFQSETGYF